jgi:hypothetical protein
MKLVVVSFVAALLAFSALPAFANGYSCYDGAGVDCYAATLNFTIVPLGGPEASNGAGSPSQEEPFPVELSGTLAILRSPGFINLETGLWTVKTEMMSFDMSGESGQGDLIRVILDYSRRSYGEINQLMNSFPGSSGRAPEVTPDPCFPAESFFDVFFELQVYNADQGHFTVTSNDPFPFYTWVNQVPIEVGAEFGLESQPLLYCSWLPGVPCAYIVSGTLTLTDNVNCEPLPATPSTWGRVKAMYR